ncbi:MAG TPA: isocitrate lyase/phosphoenolpyruvate mutase family protein [Dehalococcoidia bacterium]|nr:isocitrate lyase/phosphoenolpyruvate mutase family protein [Dehalococcoidia bacterium]
MDLAAKAEQLRKLHGGPDMLVLPNAWDVASARLFAKMGYPAIATTSAGVANSLGWPDHEQIPPDEMFAAVKRIASAVDVPVTADIEGGYGLEPQDLVNRLIDAGAAGMNVEDSDHRGDGVLVDAGKQATRLRAVVEAGKKTGVPLVLNARVDVFVREYGSEGGRVHEAIRRAQHYRQAGADCLYPILVSDEDVVRQLVDGIDGPINFMYLPDGPSLTRLRELGVRRVTFAGGLARMALAHVEEWLGSIDPVR